MSIRIVLVWAALVLAVPCAVEAQMEGLDKIITFSSREAEIRDIVMTLGKLAGVNVVVDPKIRGKMPFSVAGITAGDAIELIAGITGHKVAIIRGVVVVAQEETIKFMAGPGRSALIQLRYAKAEEVSALLNKVFAKELGATSYGPTNQVLVAPK